MKKNYRSRLTIALFSTLIVGITHAQTPTPLAAPPQNKGMPYSRTAFSTATEAIKGYTVIFPGSRYGFVDAHRVRLDDKQLLRVEARSIDNKVYVPIGFSSFIQSNVPIIFRPMPSDLKGLEAKWVYEPTRTTTSIPSSVNQKTIRNINYVDAEALAIASGKKIFKTKKGLLFISNQPNQNQSIDENNTNLIDAITTLFDTPEKLADPDITTNNIPSLKRQGKWTDHVKVTPDQLKILEGDETEWPFTPTSEYKYDGFNTTLLGSKVPPPGVYPRVLFSEEDIDNLAARIKSNKLGQMSLMDIEYLFKKSWWDPSTSDGSIFLKLSFNDIKGLDWKPLAENGNLSGIPHEFKDQKAGIHNSHVAYILECLTNMALYCLLMHDDIHGKMAANAIVNYFKMREPLIDEWNSISDGEFGAGYTRLNGKYSELNGAGAASAWRNIHGIVANMNLGLSLDFAGKWMNAVQKDDMRRIIAKATYGRRAYGQDGPIRFRDVNWVSWDLPNFWALCSIEGLEGFDKEAYQSNCETVKAFCEWGIDSAGVIYESNGKTPGGSECHTLSMIALARRGENLWGHPHMRNLLKGQIQMTSPTGKVVVNSGTQYVPFSRQNFSLQVTDVYKAFYPKELYADYLLSQKATGENIDKKDETNRYYVLDGFNAENYKHDVSQIPRLRMASPTYPGFVRSFLYDADYILTKREDLKLPLTFSTAQHGVFSAYSDASKEATWINLLVRPDHYLGAGHHHADAGKFHFSALGVDWITQSAFPQVYDGKYHNQVLVDGISEPAGKSGTNYQARAKYLGCKESEKGAFASADLTQSYTYRWQTQPGQIWSEEDAKKGWELDPNPETLKMFAGTARLKMRPWWTNYTYSNYIATSRALYNPMNYVYRTTGLVRGTHSYSIIIDDLDKDGAAHDYQFTAMLNGGVWEAKVKEALPEGSIVLGYDKSNDITPVPVSKSRISPSKGEPLLLIVALGADKFEPSGSGAIKVSTNQGPDDKKNLPQYYECLEISNHTKEAHFKTLLIPFRLGTTIPKIAFANNKATIDWGNQKDTIEFFSDVHNRTKCKVLRNGSIISESL